jgi:uncharacterized RDD family membrane protein YckC
MAHCRLLASEKRDSRGLSDFLGKVLGRIFRWAHLSALQYLNDHLFMKPGRSAPLLISWATFFALTMLLYSILLHARFGQTVGEMIMHVKVWDVSETRVPSLKQALLRDIGPVIFQLAGLFGIIFLVLTNRYEVQERHADTLPERIIAWASVSWFLLELITMFTNRKRRALHDLIAGTVVRLGD